MDFHMHINKPKHAIYGISCISGDIGKFRVLFSIYIRIKCFYVLVLDGRTQRPGSSRTRGRRGRRALRKKETPGGLVRCLCRLHAKVQREGGVQAAGLRLAPGSNAKRQAPVFRKSQVDQANTKNPHGRGIRILKTWGHYEG